MGDGNYLKERNLIRIYTNSFIRDNVIFLSNIIKKFLNINSKVIHDRNNQYIIILENKDINLAREVILPFMHPSPNPQPSRGLGVWSRCLARLHN
jgi:hypothetical protein